jgi:hypothetical protein
VNPISRISASLVLTLLVWGPNAIADWQNGPDALSHSAVRFLVIFTLARVAVRWIETLITSYMRVSKRDRMPIDIDGDESPNGLARRRGDLA